MNKQRKIVILIALATMIMTGCRQIAVSLPELPEHGILVTHIKEPLLAFVDLETNQIVHEEEFDFAIHALEKIGDQQVALAGHLENDIKLLELRNGHVRNLVSSVTAVTDLLYSQVHQLLFFTDAVNNEVVFFSLDDEKIMTRLPVGEYPIALAASDRYLYVLAEDDRNVSVIDIAREQVVRTFPVPDRPTDLLVVGDEIWVGGHGGTELNEHVYVYESTSGELLTRIQVGLMPVALYTDQYDEYIWVLSHGSNEIHAIDKHSLTVQKHWHTSENPYYLTGDEHLIYVTTLDGDQLIMIDREQFVINRQIDLLSGPYGIVLGGKQHE